MSPQADQTLALLAVDPSPSAGGRTRSAPLKQLLEAIPVLRSLWPQA